MSIRYVRSSICLLLCLGWFGEDAFSQDPRPSKPNIILVNLDDADVQLLSPQNMAIYFPNLSRFATEGLAFTNLHVTTPLCGPSRAALFTAKYASHCGIRTNDPFVDRSNGFAGGMVEYGNRGHFDNDLGTWMKAAGYRTMMIGKYLHGDTVDIKPPGWDHFFSSRGANYFATARYSNKEIPNGLNYLETIDTYRTTIETEEYLGLIDEYGASGNGQPFFLYLAPLAPHQQTPHSESGMVEEKYLQRFPNALMPLTPDFQEADFSDKSTAIRDLPRISERHQERLNPRYRERILSMLSVDHSLGLLLEQLERTGLKENTYVFLTSDNGFSNGQHRMIGKGDAFDHSTRVPTYVMGPGVPRGASANHLLAHIDLAPTVLDLAGAAIPADVDGRSFRALIDDPSSHEPEAWRDAILIENWESRILQSVTVNTGTIALRMYDSVYVEWANGTSEYYDLTNDPWQEDNAIDSLTESQIATYSRRIKELRRDMNPLATISHPFYFNQAQSRVLPIQGMAEDNDGIAEVTLFIRRLSDSMYWNGQTWQAPPCTLNASITNPGHCLTTWKYLPIPQGQPADDLLEITATATSLADETSEEAAWIICRIDHTRPDAEILTPEDPAQTLEQFGLSGTATDEGGIDSVRVVIRNKVTGRYWNETEWVDRWCWIERPVRRSGRWNCRLEYLEGDFFVSVRAVDTSGNVQSPPLHIELTVRKPRPDQDQQD